MNNINSEEKFKEIDSRLDFLERHIHQLECNHSEVEYITNWGPDSGDTVVKRCKKCGKCIIVMTKLSAIEEQIKILENKKLEIELERI